MSEVEQLGSFRLRQREGLPKVSRDSLLLAGFATLRRGDRVFDLGCGVGVLLIALAGRAEGLTLDGLDLQPDCVSLSRENLARNDLPGTVYEGDVEDMPGICPAGGYDLVISNPPYFRPEQGKVASGSRGIARTGRPLAVWCRSARWLLRSGGRFALCCRPAELAELILALEENGLAPKRMQLVQSAPEKKPNLLLMEAVAQGKPGLDVLSVKLQR